MMLPGRVYSQQTKMINSIKTVFKLKKKKQKKTLKKPKIKTKTAITKAI